MPQLINSKAEWDALPVGTSVGGFRAGSGRAAVTATHGTEHGLHIDGLHFTAGGSFWSHLWPWVLDASVAEPTSAPDPIAEAERTVRRCIEEHALKLKELDQTPMHQYRLMTESEKNPDGPDKTVIAELLALGWTPPTLKGS